MEFIFNGLDLKDIENRSLSEESIDRIQIRREKMAKDELKRRIKYLVTATALAVALIIGAGNNLINEIHDKLYIDSLASQYQSQVIGPETHRTNDGKNYFFDYNDLALRITNSDSIDEDIYLLVYCIGDYQTNLVLEKTDYKSLDHYLQMRNYKSIDDFQKDTREKLIIEEEIGNKQNEINRMNEKHPESISISFDGKGGKI